MNAQNQNAAEWTAANIAAIEEMLLEIENLDRALNFPLGDRDDLAAILTTDPQDMTSRDVVALREVLAQFRAMNEPKNLSLSKIKSFRTDDGYAFSAKISLDGKIIGDVQNHGNGGPNLYHWTDAAAGADLEAWGAARHQTPEGLSIEIEDVWNDIKGDKAAMAMLRRESKKYVGNSDLCAIRYRVGSGLNSVDEIRLFSHRERAEQWLEKNPQHHVKFYSEGK